jgi:predicted outer membrane repeat protein
VKINPIFNVDYIKDADTCEETGKFILVGAPTDNIIEDVKFDLPLTYPNDILKCEMITSKKNDKIEIICKSLFGFKGVENIIFEQRLITKKNKEIVIIPNKQIKLNKMISCIDYNSAKISLVKKRSTSGLFFLQVSKFAPLLNSFNFFLALTRRETKVPFKQNHKIPVKLKFPSKRFLRNLEEVVYGITAKCDINNELQTDYAAGYNCSNSDSFSGTPQSMEVEADKIEDIEGIPDSANPDKLNYNIDYSLLQNLKNIDNLSIAEIQNINADTCSENGEFNITAILNKSDNLKSNYSDVWLKFAVPETRGLCEITIKDKNMTMTCQNEENFYITQVFIERQAVQDSEGNEIFFIENFINPEQFSCDISLNLNTKTNATNEYEPTVNYNTGRIMFRKNNSGLSGGGIAAIVICSVVIIAVVAILASIHMKNMKKNQVHAQSESTISGFIAEGKKN